MTRPAPWSKYDRLASTYDARWDTYGRSSVRQTLVEATVRPDEVVLDVGCGTGRLLAAVDAAVRGAMLIGVDPSAAMIELAARRLGGAARLLLGVAEEIPVRSGSVDWLFNTSMFHDVRDPFAARREFRRVLRPGGTLVLTDWCADFRVTRLQAGMVGVGGPGLRHVYGALEMQALLVAGGLEVLEITRFKATWCWGLMTVRARKLG